jgi:membrane protease YdiL (CAAX protease family)
MAITFLSPILRDFKLLFTQPAKIEKRSLSWKRVFLMIFMMFLLEFLYINFIYRNLVTWIPALHLSSNFKRDGIDYIIKAVIVAPLLEEMIFRNALRFKSYSSIFSFLVVVLICIALIAEEFNSQFLFIITPIFSGVFSLLFCRRLLSDYLDWSEKVGHYIKFLKPSQLFKKEEALTPQTVLIKQNKPLKNKYLFELLKAYDRLEQFYLLHIIKLEDLAMKIMSKLSLIVFLISSFSFALIHLSNFKPTNPIFQNISVLLIYLPFSLVHSYVVIKYKNGLFYTIVLHAIWNMYATREAILQLVLSFLSQVG